MTMPIEGMFDQNDLSQIYKLCILCEQLPQWRTEELSFLLVETFHIPSVVVGIKVLGF